jgi:hypothetical protein
VAHSRPEEPGVYNIVFSPSGEVAINLAGGAERFEITLPIDRAEPQLAPLLADRCAQVERLTFDLLRELPEFQAAAVAALNDW